MNNEKLEIEMNSGPNPLKNPYKNIFGYLGLALILGIIFDIFLVHTRGFNSGIGVFIFHIFYFSFLIIATRNKINYLKNPVAIFALVVIFFQSLWFAIFTNPTIGNWNTILLIILDIFTTLYITGINTIVWSQARSLQICINFQGYILRKIKPVIDLVFKEKILGAKKESNLKSILLGLIVLLIMLSIILPILMNADEAFKKIILDILEMIDFEFFRELFWRILVVFLVSLYIFTSWILINNNKQTEEASGYKSLSPWDNIFSIIVIGGLNLVYLLFVFVQFKYLFSGNHEIISELDITYANYIHKGFGELVFVSFINFLIYAVFHAKSVRDNKLSFSSIILLASLIIFTVIIMLSAYMRLGLYIEAYGLTELRIYVYYAIFLILAVFTFCIYKMKEIEASYPKFLFFLIFGSFTILGYINMHKIIASYNINHFEDGGSAVELDREYIYDLSDDAIEEKIYLMDKYGEEDMKYYDDRYDVFYGDEVLSLEQEICKKGEALLPFYYYNYYTEVREKICGE